MNWTEARLSDIAKIITGKTPKTSDSSNFGGSIPFITPAELDSNIAISQAPRTLSNKGAMSLKTVPANSVLVCCIGSLGKIGMSAVEVATNQQINAVIFNDNQVFPRYGFWACKRLRPILENMAPATTIAIVSKSKFQELKIPLPPLKEQERIAAILDQADELRRARRKSIDRLSDLSQAIFYEMFGNPDSNPKGFRKGKIRDLVREVKYGTSQKAHTEKNGFPVLRMGNITYGGQLDLRDLKYVVLDTKDIPKYTAVRDDILFNRTNSKELVGKTAVFDLDDPYAIAGYLVRARVNDKADPYYISGYLNSPHGKTVLMAMCKNIVGMANINAQEFQDIDIMVPPIDLQKKYRTAINSISQRRKEISISLDVMNSLFLSLQEKAFSGDL